MHSQNFTPDLLQAGLLPLDPVLPRLQPLAAIGQLDIGVFSAIVQRLPLPRLLIGPGLSVGEQCRAIGVELLGLVREQPLGPLQLFLALGDERLELASQVGSLLGQLPLLLRTLLLPQLLRVPQGYGVPIGFMPPLTELVFAERQLLLAVGNVAEAVTVIVSVVAGVDRNGGRPVLQLLDSPPQLRLAFLGLRFPLAVPEARRPQLGLDLGRPGMQLGFASIDFTQPLAKVTGELRYLKLQLFAAGTGRLAASGSDQLVRRFIHHLQQGRTGIAWLQCFVMSFGIAGRQCRVVGCVDPRSASRCCLGDFVRSSFANESCDQISASLQTIAALYIRPQTQPNPQSFPRPTSASRPAKFSPRLRIKHIAGFSRRGLLATC